MNNKYFKIGNLKIGVDYPPLVIAEIGINHSGSIKVAKEMVDSAQSAGAKIIKHQTHIVDDEMIESAKYVLPGNSDQSIYKIMDDCALSESEERELKEYVENKNMIFLSTPFSRAAADRLQSWDVPAFKIGSGECNNYPLLEHISDFGKPIILSTGMNTIKSVHKAISIFESKNIDYALLHTTNLYPTPNNLVRLGALSEMQKAFPGSIIGLSDHTLTNHACFAAVALGASILERHFTDSMQRNGPDIVCSMDENACKELIQGSKIIWEQRGGKKEPADEEKITMNFAFSSVCSIKDIKVNEVLTKDNVWVKRPGNGNILAEDLPRVLGKIATRDIPKDMQIDWDDIK